jgi:hypothetical protein
MERGRHGRREGERRINGGGKRERNRVRERERGKEGGREPFKCMPQ